LTKAKGPILAKSIRSLARHVRRAESTVRKWIKRDDWPFALAPPWQVSKVRAWAEIHLHPDPAAAYRRKAKAAEAGTGEFRGMGALTKARLQVTIERALLIRQRRQIEAGKMHDTAECERRRVQQIMEVRNRLLELPRSLAAGLAGLSAEQIEARLQESIEAILEEFAGEDQPAAGGDDAQD